jgi:hypothetical protein
MQGIPIDAEDFDVASHGVDGGVGKLVTINDCTYYLARLLHKGERETEYAAVNTNTGLQRFVIKIYEPGLTEQEITNDAEQRLVAHLTIKARGMPVVRADVVESSCGPVRLQRAIFGEPTGELECTDLVKRAQGQYHTGEFRTAIETCNAIIKINRYHTDAIAIHALCLLALSDAGTGLKMMCEALKMEPNDEQLNRLAAECAAGSGASHVAIALLHEEVERAPGDVTAAERLVELLLQELLVANADQMVQEYRDRLSPEDGAKYFAAYDACVDRAREEATQVARILAMQEKRDWHAARAAWEPLVSSGQRLARLNMETCRYHLNESIDLRGLLALAMASNAVIRSVAFTLVLLGAARMNESSSAFLAAQAVKAMFTDSMDLCGVPIWTQWDQHVSGRPEPVVVALRALAASTSEREQRHVFEWTARHYESYAERIGSAPLVLGAAH